MANNNRPVIHLKQKEEKGKKPTGLHLLLFLFTVLINKVQGAALDFVQALPLRL